MMMGGLKNQFLRTVECLLLSFLIILRSTYALEGFLSIACSAESNATEAGTNLVYISDEQWFPVHGGVGKICNDLNKPGLDNGGQKVRTFEIDSGKRCYNLPTTEGQEYLIRGTFLVSDSLKLQSGSLFDVLIGVTQIGLVNSSSALEVEGIFRAASNQTDFCLVHSKGYPYISKLELRHLDGLDYLKETALSVLKLVSRTNVGGSKDLRFPDDPSDRIWKPAATFPGATIVSNANAQLHNAKATAPLNVLLTAFIHPDRLEFTQHGLDSAPYNYSVKVYFLELNSTVTQGQRVFDIYINNVKQKENFDILSSGSNYQEVSFIVLANGSLNITLAKVPTVANIGPICNAYEVLQVHSWVQTTNPNDVNVILQVRKELLTSNKGNEILESWSGDPCLPDQWPGLCCSSIGGSWVINKMDLSSKGLEGPFPTKITDLDNLEELNLSCNYFGGKIPEFQSYSKLISLDLSDNDLTGLLPKSLGSLKSLEKLYYGCNPDLDGELPPDFNISRLKSDFGRCKDAGSTSSSQSIVIGTIASSSVVVTVGLAFMFACFWKRKYKAQRRFDSKSYPMTNNAVCILSTLDKVARKSISIQAFSLQSIEAITQSYKTLIGEGGFGSVFRGTLPDGEEVAVKVRSATSTQGTREFDNELNLLSDIRHENLVPLLGYCCENDQQILVYPFMSNGSLQDRLYGEASKRKILDWPTRLSIALGAARGLTHLHTFGRCVIHRDVKSSNILLDHSMNAKVADFGFSKYAPQEGDSGVSLEVRGTAGYLDPEYYSTQHLSAKSDVFSFGVVLLEIISGREPLNIQRPRNEWSLVEWAKSNIRESKIEEIVDPNIKGAYHAEAMWRVVEVALACIEPFSAYRPCMADIVRELEDALIIENNASEYMKSIDSYYSQGGSNRFSIVIEKKTTLPPMPSTAEPSPNTTQNLSPPEPR